MFKAPTVASVMGLAVSLPVTKNAHTVEQFWSSNCVGTRREGARFGSGIGTRRQTRLVVPRASSMAAISPSPKTTEDCTQCAVVLRTTKGCGLGISVYPDFVYNAEGGGGSGKAVKLSDGCWRVQFDATEINIPDVSFRTTKLLGVPIPPPIRIKIVPDTLEGTVDLETGKIVLRFLSKFYFSATRLYRPPPLVVDTVLTTEDTHGEQRGGTGSRLDADGNCRLVGVARLVPIGDLFMDNFLMLPADCYASMNANFNFNFNFAL